MCNAYITGFPNQHCILLYSENVGNLKLYKRVFTFTHFLLWVLIRTLYLPQKRRRYVWDKVGIFYSTICSPEWLSCSLEHLLVPYAQFIIYLREREYVSAGIPPPVTTVPAGSTMFMRILRPSSVQWAARGCRHSPTVFCSPLVGPAQASPKTKLHHPTIFLSFEPSERLLNDFCRYLTAQ